VLKEDQGTDKEEIKEPGYDPLPGRAGRDVDQPLIRTSSGNRIISRRDTEHNRRFRSARRDDSELHASFAEERAALA
jgi:hypothetical protein